MFTFLQSRINSQNTFRFVLKILSSLLQIALDKVHLKHWRHVMGHISERILMAFFESFANFIYIQIITISDYQTTGDFVNAPWYLDLKNKGSPAAATIWGARVDKLVRGQKMFGGSCLVSFNNLYAACFQTDGNFVVYKAYTAGSFSENVPALWSSNTCTICGGSPIAGKGYYLEFNTDGNVYIKDDHGQPLWASMTNNKGATSSAMMIMQDDGNLVIYTDWSQQLSIFCTKICNNAGFKFEEYSPCYKNSDVIAPYANIDAMGAGSCRNNVFKNYEVVDPNGYVSCGSAGYKFLCKDTSSRILSPCYRNEDAEAVGLPNRDALSAKWCRDHGYDSTDSNNDCGNWYYRLHCTQHWSPCYRNEDAYAAGLPNRDALGNKWCSDHGYEGKDGEYIDCGNWYFKFRCKY